MTKIQFVHFLHHSANFVVQNPGDAQGAVHRLITQYIPEATPSIFNRGGL
jgi:hypothetical protein